MRQERTFGAKRTRRLAVAGIGLTALVPVAASAALGMLSSLERGAWEVRFRDGAPARKLCVASGQEFLQLGHRGAGCKRFVVEDGARQVTVQYTCGGGAYGRTSIRRESSDLVQIDSQGITNGRPFEFSAEARRTGACR